MIEVDCSPFKVLNDLIQLKNVLNDFGRWAFYIVPFFFFYGATAWCAIDYTTQHFVLPTLKWFIFYYFCSMLHSSLLLL